MNDNFEKQQLIVVIVKKGIASKLIETAKKGGAVGWTLVYGKGSVEKDIYQNVLGIEYQPEKEIVFIVVKKEMAIKIFNSVVKAGSLIKPGKGIAFLLNLEKCRGIADLLTLIEKGEY
ncbi:MAG: P-II family nitrogen regulator [Bacilli bacterium]|jgi:nitrogen regulatory protein P-II 1